MNIKNTKGSVILEALISIGVAVIYIAALGGLVIVSNSRITSAELRLDATLAGVEGIEAVRTIAYDDIPITDTGDLNFDGEQWDLTENGPEDLGDGISRTIIVDEVLRDQSCDIVEGGGSVDPDTKKIQSKIGWTDHSGNPQQFTLRTQLTNWQDPQGECFEVTAARCVTINTSQSSWYGGKQLREIFFTKNQCQDAVIGKVMLNWNNNESVQQVFINQDKVWSSDGPGGPSGDQTSGTELDIVDVEFGDGSIEMHKVKFSDDMVGSTITLTLIFSDGSSITTDPFIPTDGNGY